MLNHLFLPFEAISKLPLAEAKPAEGGFSYPPFELRFGGLENPPSVKFCNQLSYINFFRSGKNYGIMSLITMSPGRVDIWGQILRPG